MAEIDYVSNLKRTYEEALIIYNSLNQQLKNLAKPIDGEILEFLKTRRKTAWILYKTALDLYLAVITNDVKNFGDVISKTKTPIQKSLNENLKLREEIAEKIVILNKALTNLQKQKQ